jgi:single-strand DNA-binding protein
MASRSWNRVELIGNVTKDLELRYTPSGAAVCTFSIATNRTFVTDGEKREETDFHRLVAWNKLAELCSQLIKKGNRIFVSGRLQNRSWETPEGQNRQMTEIVLEDMILLTSKMGSSADYAEEVPAEVVPSRSTEEMPKAASEASAKPASVEKTDEKPSATHEEESGKPKKVVTEEVGNLDDLPF